MIVHATTVAVDGAALVIGGPSGSGKSTLALRMLTQGARLVADDRTHLAARADGPPVASAPAAIDGLIEARGLGLIETETAGPTPVAAMLDMAQTETQRLPAPRTTEVLGCRVPLLLRVDTPGFAAALVLWLRARARKGAG